MYTTENNEIKIKLKPLKDINEVERIIDAFTKNPSELRDLIVQIVIKSLDEISYDGNSKCYVTPSSEVIDELQLKETVNRIIRNILLEAMHFYKPISEFVDKIEDINHFELSEYFDDLLKLNDLIKYLATPNLYEDIFKGYENSMIIEESYPEPIEDYQFQNEPCGICLDILDNHTYAFIGLKCDHVCHAHCIEQYLTENTGKIICSRCQLNIKI
jgi:hypothetical protein